MNDWKKLVRFANLLGIRIRTGAVQNENAGEFVYEKRSPYIKIFCGSKRNTEAILTLLHELGHALDWVERGRPHANEIPSALEHPEKLSKSDRRTIYEYEYRAIKNMGYIHRILNLKLPLYLMERERRFDLWIVESLLKSGVASSSFSRRSMHRKLRKQITRKTVSSLSLI